MRATVKPAAAALAAAALILLTLCSCRRVPQSVSEIESEPSSAESAVQSAADTSGCIQYPVMQSDLAPINEPADTGMLYYRSLLTPDEQQLYDFLLYYAERYDTRDIYAPNEELQKFKSIINFVYNDNPQIFWAEDDWEYIPGNWDHIFQIDYQYTRDQAVRMQKEIDSKTKAILAGIPSGQSQYDTELYLHDYLVKNCTYETTMEKPNIHNIYGAFVDQEPVCDGYAKAMQYLMNKAGILCLYVTGKADRTDLYEDHAWNMVNIDHAYYLLDVTWDDPDEPFVLHRYFNVTTDSMTGEGRTFDTDIDFRKFTLPDCSDTADNYYVKNHLTFSDYNKDLVEALKKTVVRYNKTKQSLIEINFTNADAYKKAVDQLVDQDGMWDIIDSVQSQCRNPIGDTFTHWDSDDDHILVIELHYA